MNPYIADILAQPAALRDAVENYPYEVLEDIRHRLQRRDFERVIITGMGSSYNAAYPAVIQLSGQPVPVQFVNTAELLHALHGILGTRSLVWMNSQSGESAELVHLIERIRSQPLLYSLAFVNNLSSSLAAGAQRVVSIRAGSEATVSTKTYINMMTANLLAAVHLSNGDKDVAARELLAAADAMQSYLVNWQEKVRELDSLVGEYQQLFFLGRGASMSAVWNGSLINMEAARCAFEGMHAADFRHGPLELASAGFTALVFAGSSPSSELNRDLALEIIRYGGRALWIDMIQDGELPTLLLPPAGEVTRPLLEILPLQLLSLAMAGRKGLQAGQFRYISKVTARE
jgi:glucosamine--fructose-6-phosphate aminotransferase (isomerizing)